MKRRYKVLIIIVSLFIVIGIAGKLIIDKIERDMEAVMLIEIEDVDLSTISDGVYLGSYKSVPIEVHVKVTITNHIITDIEITKHVTGQGQGAEIIIDDVINEQSLDVDLISGATYSSKIILLAIKDALS
jgi:uncharacterized protein with FMN-binding domain